MIDIFTRKNIHIILVILVAILGTLGIMVSTNWGPGLREDSFSYITAAESFAGGTGLGRWAADGTFRPLTHFPPLLPIILGIFQRAGGEPVAVARTLNISLYFITVIVASWCVYTLTASKGSALVGAILVAVSPVLIEQYSWAQSEPLFLCLSLAGISIFAHYLQSKRPLLLFGASLLAAFSLLTRFAGVAIIFSSAFVCIFFPWGPLKRRFAALCVYLGMSLIPTGLFVVFNQLLYGNLLDRPNPTWHPPAASTWMQAADTLSTWIVPSRILDVIPGLPIIFSLLLIYVLIRIMLGLFFPALQADTSDANMPGYWLYRLLAANLIGYTTLVVITVLFLDRLTPLNDRILSPIYVFGMLIGIAWASTWLGKTYSQRQKSIYLFVLLLLVSSQSLRGLIRINTLYHQGLGLATPGWHRSETIAALTAFGNVPIYTNDIPAIYFYTGQTAAFIPVKENPAENGTRGDYAEELASMHKVLRESNGVLVLFGSNISERLHSSNLEDLTNGLALFGKFGDGQIYIGSSVD